MGTLRIHDREYNIDGVIFDKDGTLIDFDTFWGPRTEQWVQAIADVLNVGEDFKQEVFEIIGYSAATKHVRAEGPLAVASMETIYILMAGVISRYGIAWHAARQLAESCAQSTYSIDQKPDEILPKGNLVTLMKSLLEAGIQVAVVTSDDRQMTEDTLSYLGIRDMVSAVVCGDDHLPNKPAPDAVWKIAEQLNIDPERMMMVGDSLSDMQFAANAGVAFRVGVSSTIESRALLAAQADALVASLDELQVVFLAQE